VSNLADRKKKSFTFPGLFFGSLELVFLKNFQDDENDEI